MNKTIENTIYTLINEATTPNNDNNIHDEEDRCKTLFKAAVELYNNYNGEFDLDIMTKFYEAHETIKSNLLKSYELHLDNTLNIFN